MAIFRKIHVTFWSDSFVSNLNEKEKLFYLYLLTNERTTQIGIYEITKKQISFDLGYSINTVSELLKQFYKYGKIMYNDNTCELAIKNWNKYNANTSNKVKVLIDKETARVKDRLLIEYLYSINTVSILNPQEEEEQKEEQKEEEDKEEDPKNSIPAYEEFSEFALLKKPNIDLQVLKLKYDAWVFNGWKDGKDNKIKNWKSKLLQTLPHIATTTQSTPPQAAAPRRPFTG